MKNKLNNELLEIEEKILDKDGIVASINSCAKNIEKVAKMIKNRKGVDALKKALDNCKKIEKLDTSDLDDVLKQMKKLRATNEDLFYDVYKPFKDNVMGPIDDIISKLTNYYDFIGEIARKYINSVSEAKNLDSEIKNVTSRSAEIKNNYKEIKGVIDALISD